jgi:hypothetical protein
MTRKPNENLADLPAHVPPGHPGTGNVRRVLVCAPPISA